MYIPCFYTRVDIKFQWKWNHFEWIFWLPYTKTNDTKIIDGPAEKKFAWKNRQQNRTWNRRRKRKEKILWWIEWNGSIYIISVSVLTILLLLLWWYFGAQCFFLYIYTRILLEEFVLGCHHEWMSITWVELWEFGSCMIFFLQRNTHTQIIIIAAVIMIIPLCMNVYVLNICGDENRNINSKMIKQDDVERTYTYTQGEGESEYVYVLHRQQH